MPAPKTIWAMIGITGAFDFSLAILTDKIFLKTDKMFDFHALINYTEKG